LRPLEFGLFFGFYIIRTSYRQGYRRYYLNLNFCGEPGERSPGCIEAAHPVYASARRG
jgi:hypothetical protein